MRKTMVGLFVGTTALLTTFGFASSANAIVLTFQNLTFSDGGGISANASFEFDGVTDTVSNVSFSTTAGTGSGITSNLAYTSGALNEPNEIAFTSSQGNDTFTILLDGSATFDQLADGSISQATLVPSPDTLFLQPSNEVRSSPGQGTQLRGVAGGTVAVTAVPFEVESGIGFALLGLGAAWKLRKKAKAKVEA
ncbi:MAG: hypothetical protein GVY17_06390, partial [Cyanobacteria bacterium]|nr:hypothetical protein [Cyanobacteria bacterium GSL.Bin21]